jgi:DNA-binding response OmpR family regulator
MPEILVVKDDASACEALAAQLRRAGYQAHTATAVPDAMQILRDREPDLLITEVRLKGYNGLHLVAMAPRPLPAIVITAQHDTVVATDARRLGAEYVSGTSSIDRLGPMIAETLRRAEERGVFLPARVDARAVLPLPIPATLDDSAARILDVSAGGARLEVERQEGRALAATVPLRVESIVIPVDIAWQRQLTPRTVSCGVSVDWVHRPAWAAALAPFAKLADDMPPPAEMAMPGGVPSSGRPGPAPFHK